MPDYTKRIQSQDIGLFSAIPSETSEDDKRSLLLLQKCIRESGSYVYLEIGSHLGGSIQPHYVDPLCKLIYSIDKRPLVIPDERGRNFEYPDNSSARMLSMLANTFPSVNSRKIEVFDCDASDVDHSDITEKPHLCFIDGEHTNSAVFSDFKFCLDNSCPDSIICFHDANFIFRGIQSIKAYLSEKSLRFEGIMLGGCTYVILLNEAVETYSDKLRPFCQSESNYFKKARILLLKERLNHRWPLIYRGLRLAKRVVMSPRRWST